MTTMFLVIGLKHRFVPSDSYTVGFARKMEAWVPQWTCSNNTLATLHENPDEAVRLWRSQRLGVPVGFDEAQVRLALEFTLSVTKFEAGIETYSTYTQVVNLLPYSRDPA